MSFSVFHINHELEKVSEFRINGDYYITEWWTSIKGGPERKIKFNAKTERILFKLLDRKYLLGNLEREQNQHG